jgi:hypothetical protein
VQLCFENWHANETEEQGFLEEESIQPEFESRDEHDEAQLILRSTCGA